MSPYGAEARDSADARGYRGRRLIPNILLIHRLIPFVRLGPDCHLPCVARSGPDRKRTEKLRDTAGSKRRLRLERAEAAEAEGGAIRGRSVRQRPQGQCRSHFPREVQRHTGLRLRSCKRAPKRSSDTSPSARWGPAGAAMPRPGDPRGRERGPQGYASISLRLEGLPAPRCGSAIHGKWGLAATLAPIIVWSDPPLVPIRG